MNTKVRLYIDGVLAETANPIFSDKISIDKERESGEMFRRTKLNSEFKFVGEDYDLIFNSNLDNEFEVRVYDGETFLARGTFSKTDCRFDTDNKLCTVKTNSADEYDKILAGINNEFDLIALAPQRERIELAKRAILQIYMMHDTKVTNIIGNMSYEVNVASGINVDSLTPTALQNFNFSPIGSGQSLMVVSSMPSAYSALKGTYVGSYTGESSIFRQQGGTYTIVVGKELDTEYGDYFYFWEFKDANGSVVTIGGRPITTKPLWQNVPNPAYQSMAMGHNVLVEGLLTWEEDFSMRVAYDNKETYGRILMDGTPQHPIGKVMKISPNDLCENNLNYRYSMATTGLSNLASYIRSSSIVQAEPTKWGVNGEGQYYVQPNPLSPYDNVIPIGWSRWIPYSYWFNSTPQLADTLDLFNVKWSLNDAYPLWGAIKALLAKIDPSISFEGTSVYSEFLYGSIESGVIENWHEQYLYITPITNVKKTYYNQAARTGKITLKQIFDMLRATCQLYWYIDSQSRLRIEHITYFRNGGNYSQGTPLVDLTSVVSPMSRKNWSFGQNTFEYDKSSMNKRYEFGWNEECSEIFNGFPIDIKNKYVGKGNTEKAQASNFISDIDFIMSAPDALGDDSFAVIGTDANRECYIDSVSNMGMDFVAPLFKMQNPYLSFYFTELAYWLYNVSGNKATTSIFKRRNGQDGILKVYGVKRAKTQSLRFPLTLDMVGKEGLIVSGLGTGEWTKSQYTTEDGMVSMEILMDTAEPSIVTYGSYSHYSRGEMALNVEDDGNHLVFVFDGYKSEVEDDWGYVRITAQKRVRVKMIASTEESFDYGWANTSRVTNVEEAKDAEHNVSGSEEESFVLNAGASIYIGYAKDSSEYGLNDTVTFDIVEI